jgi:hypothetical protein
VAVVELARQPDGANQAQPATAAPGRSPVTVSPGSAQALLRLQRVAGNRAALAMLRREAAPAKTGLQEQQDELYAPEMLDLGAAGVDVPTAEADLKVLAARLDKVPALAGTDFLPFMRAYVQSAAAGKPGEALENMYSAIACLDSVGAFTVAGKHYRKLDAPPDQAWLAEQRAVAMSNVHLWSKLNKYHSIDTVKGGDAGLTLESSAAGTLFDGLSFGMDYKTNKVLGQQWKLVSKTFVSQAAGVVHAQVLKGIDPSSVLFKTEWPEIKGLIAAGTVTHLVVHFFDFVGGGNGRPGELQEIGTPAVIVSQADFDRLPRVSTEDDAEYKKTQDATYGAEEARHDRTGEMPVLLGRYRKQFREAKARIEELTGKG